METSRPRSARQMSGVERSSRTSSSSGASNSTNACHIRAVHWPVWVSPTGRDRRWRGAARERRVRALPRRDTQRPRRINHQLMIRVTSRPGVEDRSAVRGRFTHAQAQSFRNSRFTLRLTSCITVRFWGCLARVVFPLRFPLSSATRARSAPSRATVLKG